MKNVLLIVQKLKLNTIRSTIKIGKITKLFVLDKMKLSEMDNKTLSELDPLEGLTLKYTMRLFGNIKNTIKTNINLVLYKYTKLNEVDNLKLSDMDNLILKNIDMSKIS